MTRSSTVVIVGALTCHGDRRAMELSDGTLVARYRKGETACLETLVERYRGQLFGFVINMTEGREDADEVFQLVWLRVIKKIGSYKHKSFPAWLTRIARNVIIDRWRANKKMVSLDGERAGGIELVDTVADGGSDPAKGMATRELGGEIAQAIAALPREQKEVVVMRVKSGLTFKEIAAAQGVSINTALARMQYGLAKLRVVLSEHAPAARRT